MTTHLRRVAVVAGLLATAWLAVPHGQMRVVPMDEQQGHVALGLALRHLANAGIFMQTTAHPDDEDNGLLVMLNRGQGFRTALATATRGNGGQNEIGPEIFEALGVLRTEELAALHRFDGAEQYFTRAVDFGYSFSNEETYEKWGRDEIIGDFVRLIRMVRPDVITTLSPTGTGGGQHHAAAAVLSHEASKLAADPTKYPEQLKDGLRPWQPKKFYFRSGFPGAPAEPGVRFMTVNLAVYDPLVGKTYSEIGTEARSMHKCQGMAQLLALPGPSNASYRLAESTVAGQMQRDERTLFDGVDISIASLAQFAGARAPRVLVDGLSAIASAVQNAQRRFDAENDEAAVPPLVAGLRAVRVLRGQIRGMPLDDSAKYEIEFRLRQKEREFQQALIIANGVRVEALADDGVVVPGQPVKVSVIAESHGPLSVVKQVKFNGFDGDATCTLTQPPPGGGRGGTAGGGGGRGRAAAPAAPPVPVTTLVKGAVGRCEPTLRIPADARVTEPYWHRQGEAGRYTFDGDAPFGLPYRPTPFYIQVTLGFPGVADGTATEDVIDGLPVQYRYQGDILSGEKRTELLVVPALSVRVMPNVVIVPATAARTATAAAVTRSRTRPPASSTSREIRVTIVNDAPRVADSVVKLELPGGWTASPGEHMVLFTRQDESQTVRFQIRAPATTAAGAFRVRATVTSQGRTYDRGYAVIEYPHIRRQHIYDAAETTLKVIDVKTAPNLTVGYIMGTGDEVPTAIEQLGAKLEFIGADDLAWGNLSRFNTIVVGIRAYERRNDLVANNSRLLEYVRNGGTLIVQYNRLPFNDAQYGPYPAKVTQNRITDEFAPVQILDPSNPVFTTPNRITDAAWSGWVQERGVYFLGDDRDSRYRDLVQMEDPFPYNKGAKRGALVEASYGKGRWLYVGLGLWREIAAGVDGAYQLLANLISLGKTSAPPAPPRAGR